MPADIQLELPAKHLCKHPGVQSLVKALHPQPPQNELLGPAVVIADVVERPGVNGQYEFLHIVRGVCVGQGGAAVAQPLHHGHQALVKGGDSPAVDLAPLGPAAVGHPQPDLIRPLIAVHRIEALGAPVQVGQHNALGGLYPQVQVVAVLVRQGGHGRDGGPAAGDAELLAAVKEAAHTVEGLHLGDGEGLFPPPLEQPRHQIPRPQYARRREGGHGEGGQGGSRRQHPQGDPAPRVPFPVFDLSHGQPLDPGGRKWRIHGQLHAAVLITVQQVGDPFVHLNSSFVSSSFSLSRPLCSLALTAPSLIPTAAATSFTLWA